MEWLYWWNLLILDTLGRNSKSLNRFDFFTCSFSFFNHAVSWPHLLVGIAKLYLCHMLIRTIKWVHIYSSNSSTIIITFFLHLLSDRIICFILFPVRLPLCWNYTKYFWCGFQRLLIIKDVKMILISLKILHFKISQLLS